MSGISSKFGLNDCDLHLPLVSLLSANLQSWVFLPKKHITMNIIYGPLGFFKIVGVVCAREC